jgi:hypothetical protein
MKTEVRKDYVRVIPQFTIRPNVVSLIAEEDHKYFKKGAIVLQCSRDAVYGMHKPLVCECHRIKGKEGERIIAKIVLKGEYEKS